jgi:hypothetical protein
MLGKIGFTQGIVLKNATYLSVWFCNSFEQSYFKLQDGAPSKYSKRRSNQVLLNNDSFDSGEK